MRSGFGGFNKLSSVSTGKKSGVDSFGSLTSAILSVLGNTNTQIFTTAVASSVTVVTSGSTNVVSRWDPLYAPTTNLHLTQSTLSNMPTYDSVKQLGNTFGIRGIVDDTLTQNSFGPSATTAHTFLVYGVYTTYASVGDEYLSPIWNQVGASSQIYGIPRVGNYNASAGESNMIIGSPAVTLGLGYRRVSAYPGFVATTMLPKTNFFRAYDATINSSRTGSFAAYDENGSLFNYTFLANQGQATSNKTSLTFTQASMSASLGGFTNADWDAMYPSNAYKAMKIQILRSVSDEIGRAHV
mgnify:CR=1 FL=1